MRIVIHLWFCNWYHPIGSRASYFTIMLSKDTVKVSLKYYILVLGGRKSTWKLLQTFLLFYLIKNIFLKLQNQWTIAWSAHWLTFSRFWLRQQTTLLIPISHCQCFDVSLSPYYVKLLVLICVKIANLSMKVQPSYCISVLNIDFKEQGDPREFLTLLIRERIPALQTHFSFSQKTICE